jgi:hypothetical protein
MPRMVVRHLDETGGYARRMGIAQPVNIANPWTEDEPKLVGAPGGGTHLVRTLTFVHDVRIGTELWVTGKGVQEEVDAGVLEYAEANKDSRRSTRRGAAKRKAPAKRAAKKAAAKRTAKASGDVQKTAAPRSR